MRVTVYNTFVNEVNSETSLSVLQKTRFFKQKKFEIGSHDVHLIALFVNLQGLRIFFVVRQLK